MIAPVIMEGAVSEEALSEGVRLAAISPGSAA